MTVANLKVKIVRKPQIKIKVLPKFPGSVSVIAPILLNRTGGNYSFSLDVNALEAMLAPSFTLAQTQQIITSGAAIMAATDGIIAFNKTVGSASAVTVAPSLSKVGSCLISDFKNDAGTNHITITLTAPDTFPGGATTRTITANGGSVRLTPIPGVGYAL